MAVYFIPHTASQPCATSLIFWYVSIAIAAVALFIYGIAKSDTIYVAIAIIMVLGNTVFGCAFARVFDYCRSHDEMDEKNNYRV